MKLVENLAKANFEDFYQSYNVNFSFRLFLDKMTFSIHENFPLISITSSNKNRITDEVRHSNVHLTNLVRMNSELKSEKSSKI